MSDVSKLKINNVTYNIKDSLALRDAPSDGEEYVRKNGAWEISSGGESDSIVFGDDSVIIQPGEGVGFYGDAINFENGSAIITTSERTIKNLWDIVADSFTTTVSYSTDDYVIHEENLYQFITDHPAGEWNDEDVVVTTIEDGLNSENSGGSGGNENNSKAQIMYYYEQTVNTATNAEIFRIIDPRINTDTVVLECAFANPEYIIGKVSWTSYEGYIAFTGTCTTVTTANITLAYKTEDNISNRLFTLLWENPNPNNAFASQTISLDLSKYEIIAIKSANDVNASDDYRTYQITQSLTDGKRYKLFSSNTARINGVHQIFTRDYIPTATGILFGNGCSKSTTATETTTNERILVPQAIYGISKYSELDLKDDSKVSKSGDTMTGHLRMEAPSKFVHQSFDYSEDETPSEYYFINALEIHDSGDNNMGYIQHVVAPGLNNKMGINISAARHVNDAPVYHGLSLTIDSNGNKNVTIDQAAWRNALGNIPWVSSSTTLPLSASGIIASENANLHRSGNVVTFNFYGNLTVTSANTYYNIATIPSGYRPASKLAFYTFAYQSATLKGTARFSFTNDTTTLYFATNVSGGPYTYGCSAAWITADS